MMSVVYIFWMFVILFAIVGGMRGWAKELLVSFSVILALGLNHVIRRYIPVAQTLPETDVTLFWVRTIILIVLVFFGYQTVVSIERLAARAATRTFTGYIVWHHPRWYQWLFDRGHHIVLHECCKLSVRACNFQTDGSGPGANCESNDAVYAASIAG